MVGDENSVCSGLVRIILSAEMLGDNPARLLELSRLAARVARSVEIDCSHVSFLPTPVLQILLALRRSCQAKEVPMSIVGVQDSTADYLRLAGLEVALHA
jgi:anti-anti-sigma regulatory factor